MALNDSCYFSVQMNTETFASVNVTFSAVSILLNIFFVHCMVVPQKGAEQLKEPLNILLGSLVVCSVIIHLCSLLLVFTEFYLNALLDKWWTYDWLGTNIILAVMMYTMMTIVSSCHWKNMFYFCQLVPVQHPLLIWFKRNIREFIYFALILNIVFFLLGLITDIRYEIMFSDINSGYVNVTDKINEKLWKSLLINHKIKVVDFWIRLGFFLLSLCLMLASSSATVLYLWRHVKNMEESGLFSPNLQRQIKMTIAGIAAQALLHFLCSAGIIIIEIVSELFWVFLDLNGYILCTIISLYSLGTAINMSVSQSLFHKRLAHVWQKILQTLNIPSLN